MIHFGAPLVLLGLLLPCLALVWARLRKAPLPILRSLALALLILSVSDPRIARHSTQNSVAFVVDRSASVTRGVNDRDTQALLSAIAASHPRWNYEVISFAEYAATDSSLGAPPAIAPAPPRDARSDAADALELALSALPVGGANQIVLLSDGRLTSDARAAVAHAQVAGVPISVVPVGRSLASDVRVAAFTAPAESVVGRPVALDVEIGATEPGSASLVLYRNGSLVALRSVDLPQGTSTHRFTDSPPEAGFFEYKAIVKKPNDEVPENDARSVSVRTVNHPSVLVVDARGDSAVPALLRAVGLDFVEVRQVPSLSALADYRQVVLVNQPLADLSERAAEDLKQFVRFLGGGLLAVLGEGDVRGFSSGSIDEILPVSLTVPEIGQKPSLALIYLLDRSSSMNEQSGGKAKIRTLREAAAASVLLLPPTTLVGIIGLYDRYDWVFPLQRLGDGAEAYRVIASMGAYGGTDIYYPLDDAVRQLLQSEARAKQILLISDGQTTEAGRDYAGLYALLDAHPEINVSAIGVSSNPNVPFLTDLVRHGHGDLFYARDFATLPQVTMQLTQRLARSRFVTGDIAVTPGASALADLASLPHLGGYVLTYPRSAAATLLWAGEDPIFSTWRTGLGSVSVLNADLGGTWTGDWLKWSGMPGFFDRLLRTTEPLATVATGVTTSLDVGPDETTLEIDARTSRGGFDNFLSFTGTLLPSAQALTARQVAPGLYDAAFTTPAEGAYALLVQEARTARSFSVPISVPYASEYSAFGVDVDALSALAAATGGRVISEDSPLGSVDSAGGSRQAHLFAPLLGATLALFLIDLVLRLRLRTSRGASD